MKDVCRQLKTYKEETSTETYKFYYDYLSPSSILLDQLSLRPKLSFDPILLDALGLKKKPQSI